ncbi:MAG: tetratricopeptide repeat protein [Gammaproteobacteria bacterium]
MTDESMSFMARLKRHHIFRVASAYAVVAYILIQVANAVFPDIGLSRTDVRIVIVVVALLFPVTLVLGWMFIPPSKDNPAKFSHWQHIRFRVGSVLALIIVVLVIFSGAYLWHANERYMKAEAVAETKASLAIPAPSAATVIPAKSIAVLPFENLSADKNNAYFADGMQDLILTKLADIGDLKVIARTSTESYGSHPGNLTTIAQQLGVATILEGSVQKAGNQVLINVQLIDASTDSHIWAQSYQRTLDNIFGVEGEVAEQIATALKAKLSPAETARLATALSSDSVANDLFLRAEYFTNRGTLNEDGSLLRQAIPLYRQALVRYPRFVLARAQLSYAESGLIWFGGSGGDTQKLIADAAAQAKQALDKQPDLVTAHLALGYSDYWGRQDYAAALKAFAAALKLRPNDAGALAAIGYVLRRQGHFDAAIDSLQQALALDPRNSSLAADLAETYAAIYRYAEAKQFYQRALALDPDNFSAKQYYSYNILLSSGDLARALVSAQGGDPVLRLLRVRLLMYARKYREALALLEGIPDTPDNFFYQVGPKALLQANLYRLSGDSGRALTLYAQALPQSRVRLAALAGNAIKQSFAWNHIAAAELGLGQTNAALAAIAKSQALAIRSGDHLFTPRVAEPNAALYAQAGRADLAVPLLAQSLATPGIGYIYSPVVLKIDPAWDPIHHDPRFQALLKKYADTTPAPEAHSGG